MRVVKETCVSTARHGAKYLLILNWHEGNSASLSIAAEELHREHGMTVLTVHACYVAADLWGHDCGGLTHGGEIEALAVLAHRPELVHLDRIDYSSDQEHGLQNGQAASNSQLSARANGHSDNRANWMVRKPGTCNRGERPEDAGRYRRRNKQ